MQVYLNVTPSEERGEVKKSLSQSKAFTMRRIYFLISSIWIIFSLTGKQNVQKGSKLHSE